MAAERNPATAHMFIINPLNGQRADSLFSTHPDTGNRIRAIGYGETRPRDDNASAAGRARNRRVTFVLQLEGEA